MNSTPVLLPPSGASPASTRPRAITHSCHSCSAHNSYGGAVGIYDVGLTEYRNFRIATLRQWDDLPGDFEATRTVHYAAIRQPLNVREFITDLKQRMASGRDRLTAALADGSSGGVKVITRHGEPWISVPKLDGPTGQQRSRTRWCAAGVCSTSWTC
ncbi:hypothetical protein [Streptomyces broussonetiae]|uniref:hypothetical protein n=1 Tax=Streptomyces broussonetiae TaxID=2686304 RepID=UPI0018EEF372|nr:hypothetical protein [Streptomyces broussonetiae]